MYIWWYFVCLIMVVGVEFFFLSSYQTHNTKSDCQSCLKRFSILVCFVLKIRAFNKHNNI